MFKFITILDDNIRQKNIFNNIIIHIFFSTYTCRKKIRNEIYTCYDKLSKIGHIQKAENIEKW